VGCMNFVCWMVLLGLSWRLFEGICIYANLHGLVFLRMAWSGLFVAERRIAVGIA
jgi:hypothetical protein